MNALAAIITPYSREPLEVLERCMASVRAQTVPTLHIMVSDGYPQDIETGPLLRHVVLDQPEKDMGNTPRAIGAALAINTGVKLIGLLDADNWLEPHHFETCIAAAAGAGRPVDIIFGSRYFRRPDGSLLAVKDDQTRPFTDTNCYVLLEGAFHHLLWWGSVPKGMAYGADRLFRPYLERQKGLCIASLSQPTVNYECLWRQIYEDIGEEPPKGAKALPGDMWRNWADGLTPREKEIAERRLGVPLEYLKTWD